MLNLLSYIIVAIVLDMKIKIPPKRETFKHAVSVRFTESEYRELTAAAGDANMEVAPFIRVIVANAVRLGVELAE